MPLTHLRSLSLILGRSPHPSNMAYRFAHAAAREEEDHSSDPSATSSSSSSSSASSEHLDPLRQHVHSHYQHHQRGHPADRKGKARVRDADYRFPERGRDGGPPDPFEVLGVNRTASQAEIKSQYYRLALILHPDSSHPSSSQPHFATLNRAYNLLSSPASRDTYIQFGQGWSSPTNTPYDNMDPMMREVLRRKAGGASRSGYNSRNAEAGRGAWGAFGGDGKWYNFPEAGVGKGEPTYMSHEKFLSLIILVSAMIAWIHYHRWNMVTDLRRAELDAAHLDASHALAAAREEAKMHGQERRENIRRKVNESKVMKEIEKLEQGKSAPRAIAPPDS